jgi:predicted outer membrane repeat protein
MLVFVRWCLLFLALIVSTSAPATVVLIGPDDDPDCDYSPDDEPFQGDAIGLALSDEATEVRLVDSGAPWVEDISVGRALVLRGGYQDCARAAINFRPSSISQTVMTRRNGRPITINAIAGQPYEVELDQIILRGNTDSQDEGGALRVEGPASVILRNSQLNANSANLAGGQVHLSAGASLTMIKSSLITGTAPDGGGIYCSDSDVYVGTQSFLGFHSAEAFDANTGNGGAIYADNCNVTILSRRNLLGSARVRNNQATNHGGVVYATNGSSIDARGGRYCDLAHPEDDCTPGDPVLFADNQAASDGDDIGSGGVFSIQGENTRLRADGAWFVNNQAYSGAAISVNNADLLALGDAYTVMVEDEPNGCGIRPCLLFKDNIAGGGEFQPLGGGALSINRVATGYIRQAVFDGNSGDLNSAIGAIIDDQDEFTITNTVFANSGIDGAETLDLATLALSGTGNLQLSGVTFTNNTAADGQLHASSGTVNVSATLVDGGPTFLSNGSGGTLNGQCFITSGVLPPGVIGTGGANTSLSNASTGRYEPRLASDAVDACIADDLLTAARSLDAFFAPRPLAWNAPARPYDAGAVERQEVLFNDRFAAN